MKVRMTIEADIELDDGETIEDCEFTLRSEPMHVAETLMPYDYAVKITPIVAPLPKAAPNARIGALAARAGQLARKETADGEG